MGKRGPCCHCGVTSTPLWRNGPPEKPVLCNACGSRWRTKGSLANYAPIHARAFSPLDFGDSETQDYTTPSKKSKGWYTNKRKMEDGYSFAGQQQYITCFEDDTSNKSSSGSAASATEGCVQFRSTDGNENSGSFQTRGGNFQIPSKRRTLTKCDGSSSIEKLRQDLVTIWQQQGSSSLSEFSEDVLLFEGEEISFNSEIGHGSVLLKPPISTREEESEASSHIIGHKFSRLSDTHLASSCCSVQSHNNEISSHQLGKEQIIQDKWDTNELIDTPGKQCASTDKTPGGPLFADPGILRSEYSSQMSINEKSSGNKSRLNSGKKVSSLTSDVAGSRIEEFTRRPRGPPQSYM